MCKSGACGDLVNEGRVIANRWDFGGAWGPTVPVSSLSDSDKKRIIEVARQQGRQVVGLESATESSSST